MLHEPPDTHTRAAHTLAVFPPLALFSSMRLTMETYSQIKIYSFMTGINAQQKLYHNSREVKKKRVVSFLALH